MGNKKKRKSNKNEEAQANRVIKIVFASLVIVGLLMMLGFSFLR